MFGMCFYLNVENCLLMQEGIFCSASPISINVWYYFFIIIHFNACLSLYFSQYETVLTYDYMILIYVYIFFPLYLLSLYNYCMIFPLFFKNKWFTWLISWESENLLVSVDTLHTIFFTILNICKLFRIK